jgi:hypothetical protein
MLVSQNFRADGSIATAPIRREKTSVSRLHTNSNEMRSGMGSAVQDLLAYGPIPPELLRPIRWDDNRLCQWCGDFCHVSHLDRCPRRMSPCGVCGEQCFVEQQTAYPTQRFSTVRAVFHPGLTVLPVTIGVASRSTSACWNAMALFHFVHRQIDAPARRPRSWPRAVATVTICSARWSPEIILSSSRRACPSPSRTSVC